MLFLEQRYRFGDRTEGIGTIQVCYEKNQIRCSKVLKSQIKYKIFNIQIYFVDKGFS